MTYRCWVWVAVLSALVMANAGVGVAPAAAADLLNDPFTGATTTAPVFGLGSTAGFPCLTADSNVEATPVPGCALDPADTAGSGALRLTDANGGEASGLFYNTSTPTAQGLSITFKQYQYGGSYPPADGIAFVLAVAPPQPTFIGETGGSLGYTAGDGHFGTGLPGGWLGIGLDVYGNFTSTNVDGSGCASTNPPWATPDLHPNEVTVRGPGNGKVGYCLLSSSLEASPLGFQLHAATRASSLRSVRIVIDPAAGTYSVAIDPLGGTNYTVVTSGLLPSFYYDPNTGNPVNGIPPSITFGWTGTTGGSVDIHEITDVDAKTLSVTPTLASTSINSIGAGASTTIVLTGDNFEQFKFTGTGADSTISFACVAMCAGPGITVVTSSIKVSADGTTITFKINVPSTQRGIYNIVIRKGSGEGAQQFVLASGLTVTPPPTITSAGTGANGTGPLLTSATGPIKSQTLVIKGANFQAPTTVPSDLVVSISGNGITVNSVGFDGDTQLSVDVDVASGTSTTSRKVTVTNPDLGSTTSGAIVALQVADSSVPVGLAPRATSGTATPPPAPTVTKIDPSFAPLGFSPVKITGSKFNATKANNFVTFTGPQQSRVLATIISASTSLLQVQVPSTAVDGPVIVAVSGAQQSTVALNFTVSNPILSSATVGGQPASGKRGESNVSLHLTGSKFQAGATVTFDPPDGLAVGAPNVTATDITVPVSVDLGAALGLRDIIVTNPDSSADTLPQSFEVKLNSQFNLALALKTVPGGTLIDTASFLPSVGAVEVTLDAGGKCTSRTITPAKYLLEASFPDTQPDTPPQLIVTLTSSNRPGTATNDDCEPNLALPEPLPAEKDWSVGPVGPNPDVSSQQITVDPVNGVYQVWLASWDWGGSVHIDVVDGGGTIGASLSLPINGVREGPAKTKADGLTDFEKQRGVYLVAPVKGSTGVLQNHQRLDSNVRNFFVRGLGFALDPTLPGGKCGVDSTTGESQDPLGGMPCPVFQWGNAFAEIGVKVWDVTLSFDAAKTMEFPTKSFADPTKPMLDLATVTYDTKNCSGGSACDHTTKLGPRQWSFPSLGFSTFGTCCAYGAALVLGKPFKAYLLDRPYLHQQSPPGTFLSSSGPLGPMLAPITVVCDKSSTGADNGTAQTGECSVNGFPGGDVYKPGVFALDMSAMDVNNDGCVELPFVADPTTLAFCAPGDDSATSPQATFQQVIRHVVTHELGHLAGSNLHTADAADLMYMYSINWTRDGHFSSQVGSLIQIHNKGQQ